MKKLYLLTTACLQVIMAFNTRAQQEHREALEDIIVETYYISDAKDSTDTDGGFLKAGSVTYRIFIDMKPGYILNAVYGNAKHEMKIETTTEFFNNEDRGDETGDLIDSRYLADNTVALDSWLTIGSVSEKYIGVPKSADPDGSVLGGENSDGGSEGIEGGILVNEDHLAGIPLTEADGLIEGTCPEVTHLGLDLGVLRDENDGPVFSSSGGAWSTLQGVRGPDEKNRVLIAQLTTDGELSCYLNIQIEIPDSIREQLCPYPTGWQTKCPYNRIQYVYKSHSSDSADDAKDSKLIIFENEDLQFSVKTSVTQNIEPDRNLRQLDLYPNPAGDFVHFRLPDQADGNGSCSLFDASGRLVTRKEFSLLNGNLSNTIDTRELSAGLYILKVTTGQACYTRRFIKQ